jgi:hypothetical protein
MKKPDLRRFLILAILVSGSAGCARGVGSTPAASSAGSSLPATATTLHSATLPAPVHAAFVGEGSLEAHGEKTGTTKLALQRLSVAAITTGDVTEMTIEHEFMNDSDERLEGTFRFPLPDGAMLTGLAMEIDGKLMDGELVERDKARKAYEQIVDHMLDPALLEWENGQTFKLRVFPIEPRKTKRVVLKVVAPLHRAADGLFFAYRPPTGDGGVSLGNVRLSVDGRSIKTGKGEDQRAASGEVLVKVADIAPAALVEHTSEGTYVFAHVDPSFGSGTPAVAAVATKGQALIVLCDRSRSMLEARALQTRTASLLLSKLDARDRFTIVTSDVNARALGTGLHEPNDTERAGALAFIDGVTPDGASDLGKAFATAGAIAKEAVKQGLEPVFVYIGDATPTWGETRASELQRIAGESFGGAPLHVVVLGKSSDEATARALSSATHGRMLRPKTDEDAQRVAEQIVRARVTRRIEDVKLVAADGIDVPLAVPGTVYEGDDVTLAAFVPKDKEKEALGMKLTGTIAGQPFEKAIAFASAQSARDVGKRWAKARIEQLEHDGDAHKEAIVKTSLDHGVMSRYTSFLVLESEEAYARLQIARKAKAASDGEARVSGKDLEGNGDGRTASISPDHLQPGDPEVRIPAPADAASVVVVFPFGETKSASWENDAHAGQSGTGWWVARFLVDAHTPDGTYEIVVRITHHDGRVEIMKLPYIVDTQRPNLDVKVRAKRNGSFEIRATQKLTQAEIDAQMPNAVGTIEEKRLRYASVLTDAKRVEVRAPDGQLLTLTHLRLGEFIGTWTPIGAVAPHGKLRLVAVDRALNERAIEVELP